MTALLYVFQHLSLEDRCRAAVVSKVTPPLVAATARHATAACTALAPCPATRSHADLTNFALQEWHHAAQHPTLWQTLDLRNRQDAGAWLARLRVCACAVHVSYSFLRAMIPQCSDLISSSS